MKSIVAQTENPAIDVAAAVPKVFPDHKLRCGVARRDAGGGGLNVSRATQLLGGKSLACYFAGGPSGDMLEAESLLHRRLSIKAVVMSLGAAVMSPGTELCRREDAEPLFREIPTGSHAR